jgi:hypothetical protein
MNSKMMSNQKAKDGMCISSMSPMKQKAEGGVKIVPPVKRKPIVVTNPNDSRLKAYQDSLALHNYSEQQSKIEGKTPPPDYWGPNSRSGNHSKITPSLQDRIKNYKSDWEDGERTGHSLAPRYGNLSNYTQKQEELFKTTKKLVDTNKNIEYNNNLSSPDISHKTIKPVDYYTGTGINDVYKKPEQPVIYKEPIQKKPSPPKSGGSPKPVEKPKPVLVKPKIDFPESTPRPIVSPMVKKGTEIKVVQEGNRKPVEKPKPIEKEIVSADTIPARVITPPDTTPTKPVVPEKVVTTDTTATEKKTTPVEKPTPKRMPKAIMPTRQGGWSKQPLLMRLFPKLYKK